MSLDIRQLHSTSWRHCRLGNRHRRRTPDSEVHILGEARPHSQLWLGLIPHTLKMEAAPPLKNPSAAKRHSGQASALPAPFCWDLSCARHIRLFKIIIRPCPAPTPGALWHSWACAPCSTALCLLRTFSRLNVALRMSPALKTDLKNPEHSIWLHYCLKPWPAQHC